MYNDSLFNAFAHSFEARRESDMSMAEYLEACRDDPMRYASAAERILAAIGEPEMIDTAKDPRLGRMFLNRTIRVYPAFSGFFGMASSTGPSSSGCRTTNRPRPTTNAGRPRAGPKPRSSVVSSA